MDALEGPPLRGKAGTPEPAAAAAAPRPSGNTSPSVPPLTLTSVSDPLCAQVDDADAAAAESRSNPHLGAMAAEKRAASPTEYELVDSRPRRRRTSAPPVVAVEAPESATKSSPSAARSEAAPLSDRTPNITAAGASNIISKSKKSDQHGGGGGEPGAAKSSSSAPGEAAAAGGGAYRVGSLASYNRIDVLGEGGFAIVWKARDIRTNELVAIKSCIESRKKKEGGQSAALLREAALLAACRGNPAVVGFREVLHGPGPDDVHIVMDFPGRSLRHMLHSRDRGPQFSESETRDAMGELLAAVEKMGEQGIVHGDLKPDNILVSRTDGRLMICDFGLAISVSEPPSHIDGTMYYSAPEQLMGDKNCGPPVDAWALGCVMAELLTGKLLVEVFHQAVQLTETIFLLAIPDEVTGMKNEVDASMQSELRDRVPEEMLSPAGFDVLNGLLQYRPQDRLTPTQALKMPWFSEAG